MMDFVDPLDMYFANLLATHRGRENCEMTLVRDDGPSRFRKKEEEDRRRLMYGTTKQRYWEPVSAKSFASSEPPTYPRRKPSQDDLCGTQNSTMKKTKNTSTAKKNRYDIRPANRENTTCKRQSGHSYKKYDPKLDGSFDETSSRDCRHPGRVQRKDHKQECMAKSQATITSSTSAHSTIERRRERQMKHRIEAVLHRLEDLLLHGTNVKRRRQKSFEHLLTMTRHTLRQSENFLPGCDEEDF